MENLASRRVKDTFPHVLKKPDWAGNGIWALGFFASSTVGISETFIPNYVLYQGKKKTGQAELEF